MRIWEGFLFKWIIFFQADLFKILDEPLSTNGRNEQNNIFDLLNTNNQSLNPLEDILFGNDLPKVQSTNGKWNFFFLFIIFNKIYFISGVNTSIPPLTVLNKNGLHIIFNFEKQEQILFIHSQATNSTSIPITNFVFKAAVPRVKKKLSISILLSN
jgi:hypothetical protein